MTTMLKTIIVSAANSDYFNLIQDLFTSIEQCRGRVKCPPIAIMDCGLSEDHRTTLSRRGIAVVQFPWDYDIGSLDREPKPFLKSLVARPRLPKHFPGYDIYLWIDADCWIQDWSAVELYLDSARRYGFSITPAIDRSYGVISASGNTPSEWALSCFLECGIPREIARKWAPYPLLNAGIFAGLARAPHWDSWSRLVREIIGATRNIGFYHDQTALNIAIREHRLPIAMLPARCNWQCHRAIPMCGKQGSVLIEPNPPFEPLGIIHLTDETKNGEWQLRDPDGMPHTRSLRFSANDHVSREI
jgi:hypothetical protein